MSQFAGAFTPIGDTMRKKNFWSGDAFSIRSGRITRLDLGGMSIAATCVEKVRPLALAHACMHTPPDTPSSPLSMCALAVLMVVQDFFGREKEVVEEHRLDFKALGLSPPTRPSEVKRRLIALCNAVGAEKATGALLYIRSYNQARGSLGEEGRKGCGGQSYSLWPGKASASCDTF